jgi:hypothetical protein
VLFVVGSFVEIVIQHFSIFKELREIEVFSGKVIEISFSHFAFAVEEDSVIRAVCMNPNSKYVCKWRLIEKE